MATSELQLREKYLKLPPDLKDSLFSMETADSIGKIGSRYNLKETIGVLADEIGLVLLGVLHPKDFITDLVEKLGVDRETAKKIADDVNKEIFQKVRISLRKLHGITDDALSPAQAPAPIPKAPEAVIKIKEEDTSKIKIIPDLKVPAPKPKEEPTPTPKIFAPPKFPAPIKITEKPTTPSIPKELPKKEIRPLEIKPLSIAKEEPKKPEIKPEMPVAQKPQEIKAEIKEEPPKQSEIIIKEQTPSASMGGGFRDRGLEVMPHSPEELKKSPPPSPSQKVTENKAKPPAPPPGLPFMDKRAEKKLGTETNLPPAPPPHHDPYRESIN